MIVVVGSIGVGLFKVVADAWTKIRYVTNSRPPRPGLDMERLRWLGEDFPQTTARFLQMRNWYIEVLRR